MQKLTNNEIKQNVFNEAHKEIFRLLRNTLHDAGYTEINSPNDLLTSKQILKEDWIKLKQWTYIAQYIIANRHPDYQNNWTPYSITDQRLQLKNLMNSGNIPPLPQLQGINFVTHD